MARGGGGALPDLSRLSVTPTGQMVRYDPATSNGHDACAITHEEFEEGEMVWRNSEDGPIRALYKPWAIYHKLHHGRFHVPGVYRGGLWQDPVTGESVSYARETNPTDGLLRWMWAKNTRPIIVDADPAELHREPLRSFIKADRVFSGRPVNVMKRSFAWMHDVYKAMGTGKAAYEFNIRYKNNEWAYIRYERGDTVTSDDGSVWYRAGKFYRMVKHPAHGVMIYPLANMWGHLAGILRHKQDALIPHRELKEAIKIAEQNNQKDRLLSLERQRDLMDAEVLQILNTSIWIRDFQSVKAPIGKYMLAVASWDEGASHNEHLERAIGGGMETLDAADVVRIEPQLSPEDQRRLESLSHPGSRAFVLTNAQRRAQGLGV